MFAKLTTLNTLGVALSFSYADAKAGGYVCRSYDVYVYGQNSAGWSPHSATITVSNPIPPQLSGITVVMESETVTTATYRVSWPLSTDDDIRAYRIWGDTASGFVPSEHNLMLQNPVVMVI